jgi:hypothetical protein
MQFQRLAQKGEKYKSGLLICQDAVYILLELTRFGKMCVMATEKFKAMVHYIVAACDDPQRLGAVRLNKICWFTDTIT